jgi:hypothetical protein
MVGLNVGALSTGAATGVGTGAEVATGAVGVGAATGAPVYTKIGRLEGRL